MPTLALKDDRGRSYRYAEAPRRIVSLVPSDTYTLVRLGVGDRLVGRTKYCVEPEGDLEGVTTVGGTKDPNIEQIIALRPDLVIMNQEENTRSAVESLEEKGVRAFVTFPKRVAESVALVARLARLLGDPTELSKDVVRRAYQAYERFKPRERPGGRRVFVPIWMEPLMTIHGDTYISSVLDHLGLENVFRERRRMYPLAADLGERAPLDAHSVGERDTRYPRITVDELVAAKPDIMLLPDEPHPFSESDRAMFLELDTPASKAGRVLFVRGRDLMWPGLRSLESLANLEEQIERAF